MRQISSILLLTQFLLSTEIIESPIDASQICFADKASRPEPAGSLPYRYEDSDILVCDPILTAMSLGCAFD
jgi:hypothetical protein